MTPAKKTKTAAKKNNDISNYQRNGGNIGPTGPWVLPPLGPPWALPGPSWALPGPPGASLGPSLGPWAPVPWALGPWAQGPQKPMTAAKKTNDSSQKNQDSSKKNQ